MHASRRLAAGCGPKHSRERGWWQLPTTPFDGPLMGQVEEMGCIIKGPIWL